MGREATKKGGLWYTAFDCGTLQDRKRSQSMAGAGNESVLFHNDWDPGLQRKRIAHRRLGQAENSPATGKVVCRFVHIHSKILKKAKAPGQPRGLCGCLWCLMSLQQVNACIRIGF